MKQYVEPTKGTSPEEHRAVLIEHLKDQISKALADYRGQTHRVWVTYPAPAALNDVLPLWKLILHQADFLLCIVADSSSDIPAILQKIDKDDYTRITVVITVTTDSKGKWKEADILSKVQELGVTVFPRFIPEAPPKDWATSLDECLKLFDSGKCAFLWADTAALQPPQKKGIASARESEEVKNRAA